MAVYFMGLASLEGKLMPGLAATPVPGKKVKQPIDWKKRREMLCAKGWLLLAWSI